MAVLAPTAPAARLPTMAKLAMAFLSCIVEPTLSRDRDGIRTVVVDASSPAVRPHAVGVTTGMCPRSQRLNGDRLPRRDGSPALCAISAGYQSPDV